MPHNVKRPAVAAPGASGLCSAATQNAPANSTKPSRLQITVAPVNQRDRFSARLDGRLLVKSSRTPFCDAARLLIAEGLDPSCTLVMRHRGSEVDVLRARLGVAAGLTVR